MSAPTLSKSSTHDAELVAASGLINSEIGTFLGHVQDSYPSSVGRESSKSDKRHIAKALLAYLREYDDESGSGSGSGNESTAADLAAADLLIQEEAANTPDSEDAVRRIAAAHAQLYASSDIGNASATGEKKDLVTQLLVLSARHEKLTARVEKMTGKLNVTTGGYSKLTAKYEETMKASFDTYNLTTIECQTYESLQAMQSKAVTKRVSDLQASLGAMEATEGKLQRKYAHLMGIARSAQEQAAVSSSSSSSS